MSRRLSIQMKNANVGSSSANKPKVKFPDELVFLDSIKGNDVENVKQMLRRASLNVDLNKINDSGLTALHQAVLENSFELVKILLENKANINHPDEDSWTPLHAACAMGYLEMSNFLLENGADVNALTADNERPLDLIDQSNFPLISLLLNYMKMSEKKHKKDKKDANSDTNEEEDEEE